MARVSRRAPKWNPESRLLPGKAFNEIESPLEEMSVSLVRLAWLRPGFKDYNNYCKSNDIQLYIVKHGLEFYVDAVLQEANLRNVPSCSIGVSGTPKKLEYSYPYAAEECWDYGNCKCKVLFEHRKGGTNIIYIGDRSFRPLCRAASRLRVSAVDAPGALQTARAPSPGVHPLP